MARTNKTSQVLRLVNPAPEPPPLLPEVQPKKKKRRVINNGELISILPGDAVPNPAIKPPKIIAEQRRKPLYVMPSGEKQVVNVAAMLINEQLGPALERFNVCACDKCCHLITETALREMPPAFVHVSGREDAEEVNRLLDELRPEVIKVLTRLVMAARKKPWHKT